MLGYPSFVAGLEAGVAAHHAGLVPPFREAVEALLRTRRSSRSSSPPRRWRSASTCRARSVVIEELSKFGGDGHEELTPGEYTQLTGRAGRRGIDEVGYAAVLCSPFHTFDDVAALASARSPCAALVVPADLQHGGQPRPPLHPTMTPTGS